MFGFNKKEKKIDQEKKDEFLGDMKKPQLDYEKIAQESVNVYVMPQRANVVETVSNSAKKTGMVIMIGGIVFIFLVGGFFYYFLIKKPTQPVNVNKQQTTEGGNSLAKMEEKKVADQEVVSSNSENTEQVIEEIELASSTENLSTSTLIATSTEEQSDIDADKDGLSLFEEALLGSSDNSSDSDNDGYHDFSELMYLYDLAGVGRLTDNDNISTYVNDVYKYSILYPDEWMPSNLGGVDSVLFKSSGSDLIQVVVQANASGQRIEDWYVSQFPNEIVGVNNFVEGKNYKGVKSLDSLTVYLTDNDYKNIYILSYATTNDAVKNYINIFNMMVKSFKIN